MDAPMNATLPAADMTRAKEWYRDKLGMKPSDESPMGEAMYETGGSGFMLYPSPFAGTNQATAAGFMVDDFDGTVAELRSNGVIFEEYDFGEGMATVDGVIAMPDGRKGAWFKDSEGNILGLAENI
jgi:catechol 2,3-dioxygenase-like lactoylglutathione lyase family enzyme